MITYSNKLKEISPEELLGFLEKHYTFEIPIGIDSEMAMRKAGNLLGTLTNSYSYLASVLAALTIHTKAEKAKVPTRPKTGDLSEYETQKKIYEEMALRKFLVEQYVDIIRQQYSCVSRMLTVKIEADKELRMSDSKK